jgi:putative holliday junction resolvase
VDKKGRILALDLGDKRIGVAMSDELQWTAQPFKTLHRTSLSEDLKALEQIIQEHEIKLLVVGVPYGLSENITPQTKKVLELISRFKKEWDVPIETIDESLTTSMAEEVLISANVSRKKRKGVKDTLAAVLILQAFLRERESI